MPKIPKQRTGSGGWPDRARVPAPKGGSGKKGCAVTVFGLLGGLTAITYGVTEAVRTLI